MGDVTQKVRLLLLSVRAKHKTSDMGNVECFSLCVYERCEGGAHRQRSPSSCCFGWDVSLYFGLTGLQVIQKFPQQQRQKFTCWHMDLSFDMFIKLKKQVLTIWFLNIKLILFLFIIFCCWSAPGQKVFLSFVWFTYDGFWRQKNICNHSCTKEKKRKNVLSNI